MPEGAARVKPHFQNIGAFGVMRRVLLAQHVLHADAAPGFNAALLHNVGGFVQNFHGARVQLARVFVQEKRHRHAPAALAADAPVGAVGNHVAQAGFTAFGVKARGFNGLQCGLAQGLRGFVFGKYALALVHADKPLGGSTVDDGRFMPPAVRVAVRDGLGSQQAVVLRQCFDDLRAGFPDVQAAKQRQRLFIAPVALHGVDDVFIAHAVRHARVKVVHTVGGR